MCQQRRPRRPEKNIISQTGVAIAHCDGHRRGKTDKARACVCVRRDTCKTVGPAWGAHPSPESKHVVARAQSFVLGWPILYSAGRANPLIHRRENG